MTSAEQLATLVVGRFGPINAYALAALHANEPRCARLVRHLERGVALPDEVAREAVRLAVDTMQTWGVTR